MVEMGLICTESDMELWHWVMSPEKFTSALHFIILKEKHDV
jgi:hypothetical protein